MTCAGEQPCMADFIARYFSWAFIVLAFVVVGVLIKWLFIDIHPVSVKYYHPILLDAPIKQRPASWAYDHPKEKRVEVRRGQTYYRFVDYCTDGKPGIVSVAYINGIQLTSPSYSMISEAGCFKRSFVLRIPETLPEGNYTVKVHVEVAVNPIKTVVGGRQEYKIRVVK